MRAVDIMTTEVITVEPTATVHAVAALLSERGISGLPVIDADRRVIGMVSEGDLLHRVETGTERRIERRRRRWFDRIAEQDLARDYAKSHARKVEDVMSRKVIYVLDATDLADVAMTLETHRIKRVPVLRDGRLVGIISRANLVRALAATKPGESEQQIEADDRTIRTKLLTELSGREWVRSRMADIIVKDGVVHLWFSDDQSPEEQQAMRIAAENIPEVRRVEEHLAPIPRFPAF